MKSNEPTILVIIGISGDLSRRKLLPAIGAIANAKMTPEQFKIVGVTRQKNIDLEKLLHNTKNKDFLIDNTELFEMDLNNEEEYERLNDYLEKLGKKLNDSSQCLFYLSVPPTTSESIIDFLGSSSFGKKEKIKLLLEKPFGTDLKSAKELAKKVNKYFKAEQIYRIDHYLAKETAQNIIVFRNGNSLFKKTWNKDFIERIEVNVYEDIGIEGRINFYEQTGALRDFQSHLLQLLALVLMKLPECGELKNVPELRLGALKQLRVVDAIRGQYEGYKDEVNNKESFVETFISIRLESSDPDWFSVPLTITTGKALNEKATFIKILYKKDKDNESNELLLRLQPEEGIQFNMWAKQPGYEHKIKSHNLSFKFSEHYDVLPEAYEQVLFNAINSDHSLFTTGEEIIETWRIIDNLQKEWMQSNKGLIIYKKGSSIVKP